GGRVRRVERLERLIHQPGILPQRARRRPAAREIGTAQVPASPEAEATPQPEGALEELRAARCDRADHPQQGAWYRSAFAPRCVVQDWTESPGFSDGFTHGRRSLKLQVRRC